jgi:hypothetical protein
MRQEAAEAPRGNRAPAAAPRRQIVTVVTEIGCIGDEEEPKKEGL